MSKAMADLSTEQLAALPEAERQALEEQMTAQFAPEDDGADTDTDTDTDTDMGADAGAGGGQPSDDASTAGKDDNTDDATAVQDDDAPVEEAPTYTAVAPEDAATQIQALKDAKAAARAEDRAALKKVNDGELDFDEYEKIKDKADQTIEDANDKIADINKAISKAEVALEMTAQATQRAWDGAIKATMASAKAEGLDYTGNEALNKELNGLVRAFGLEASERGMSDVGLKASKWALQQAHDTMKLRHPELVVATKSVAVKQQEPGAPRHKLVTLAAMPNADRAPIEGDEVSRFAATPGHKVGEAIASMSKADAEKLFASL